MNLEAMKPENKPIQKWGPWGEVRLNPDGSIDEIVAHTITDFHLEQMDDGHWWMAIGTPTGDRLMVNLFTAHGAHIKCNAEAEDGHVSAGFEPKKEKKKRSAPLPGFLASKLVTSSSSL